MNKKQMQKLINIQLGNMYQNSAPRKRKTYSLKNFYYDVGEIVNTWSVDDLQEFITIVMNRKSKTFAWLKKQLFPMKLNELHCGIPINTNRDVKRLLFWCAALITANSDKINKYIKGKSNFEINFINGNYEKANEFLNEIKEELGYSFWGIDSRLALYEYSEGLEKNKELLEEISLSDCNIWVKACADFFSFKAEKNVNNRQYVHRIENFLELLNDNIKPYFVEKLFPIVQMSLDDIYDVLCLNSCSSLIDIYNVFIKVCTRVLSDNEIEDRNLKKWVNDALALIGGIDDIVLYKLKWKSCSVDVDLLLSEKDLEFLAISDLYTKGEYETVIENVKKYIKNNANCFEIYEYYVKAHIMLNKSLDLRHAGIIREDLLLAMYGSYIKDNESSKAYFTVSHILRLFSNSNLGTGIGYFIADKYMIGTCDILEKGKEYMSPIINVKYLNAVKEKGDKILDTFKRKIFDSSTIELYEYMYKPEKTLRAEQIDDERIRWYAIKKDITFRQGNPLEELEKWYLELKNLEGILISYQKERISTELYYLYIKNEMYLEAEELMVDETIHNNYSTIRMDLDCIFNSLFIKNKEMKASICTPIATFLFGKEDYTTIYTAVANFLNMNNVSKPSELFGKEHIFTEARLMFFLKKICIKEVLDSMYSAFDTDEDVENERIEICKYLQVRDKEHVSEYIEEISQILQNRKIMQGVKYFEDVKIDLDFNKIYSSHKEVFEDDYKRFRQIENLDNDYAAFDISNNRLFLYIGGEQQTYSHALLVFKEFFEDYRHEFTFGKFGLDPILGTRIRHGCLQNQIRVAFENNNIAFVCRSAEDRTYLPTKSFEDMCKNLSDDMKSKLYEIISAFSRNIDDYIEEITTDFIRIKINEKNPKGLFDFNVKIEEIALLMQMIKGHHSANLVCEMFESYWIGRLEKCLNIVRSFFENEVKSRFILILRKLEEDMSLIVGGEHVQSILLDSISRSRTELQKGIDFVKDWFKLPKKTEIEDYTASDLLETCELINRRVVSNYDAIKINTTIDVDSLFLGDTFSHMIDVLIILFTNTFYHSGYIDNLSDLNIDFEMTETENNIILRIKNNLAEHVKKEEVKETVLDIQHKLEECIRKKEYYNYEGKSGYIKICKILECNLGCQNILEFGLMDDENSYYVMIKMDKQYIVKKVI